jgi:hypothetical protein
MSIEQRELTQDEREHLIDIMNEAIDRAKWPHKAEAALNALLKSYVITKIEDGSGS